jgi:hypothetical protein
LIDIEILLTEPALFFTQVIYGQGDTGSGNAGNWILALLAKMGLGLIWGTGFF